MIKVPQDFKDKFLAANDIEVGFDVDSLPETIEMQIGINFLLHEMEVQ